MASWVIPETPPTGEAEPKKLSLSGGELKMAWTLFRGGKAIRLQGEYSKAMHYLNQARAAFEKLGDEYGQACACQELAFCSGELNRNSMALEYAHQSVKKFQEQGKHLELAWSYDYLSYIYFYHYRYKEALVYSKKAQALFMELASQPGLAWNSCNMARIHLEMILLNEALIYYQEALAIFQKLKNEQGIALCWLGLGTVYRSLCQFDEAKKSLAKARALYSKLKIRDHVGWCFVNEAAIVRIEGNDVLAMDLNKKANQAFLGMKKNDGIAWGLFQIGQIMLERGLPIKSWEFLREALNLHKDIYNHKGIGWGENELGKAYYELGELDRAKENFLHARTYAEQYGVDPLRFEVEKNLANMELDEGNLQRTHKYIESAYDGCFKKQVWEIMPDVLRTRARYAILLGDWDGAEKDCVEAEKYIAKYGLARYRPTLALLKGELLVHQGKIDEAVHLFEEAVQLAKSFHQKKVYSEAVLALIQLKIKKRPFSPTRKLLDEIDKLNRVMGSRKLKAKIMAVRAWLGFLENGFIDHKLTNQVIQIFDSSRQIVPKCLLLGWLRTLLKDEENRKEAVFFETALEQLITTGPVDLNIIHGETKVQETLPISLII